MMFERRREEPLIEIADNLPPRIVEDAAIHDEMKTKRMRLSQRMVQLDENETRSVVKEPCDRNPPSIPQHWSFSRHPSIESSIDRESSSRNHTAQNLAINEASSTMVLSEHLGRTSDVFESLTHDVQNWSLTRLSTERFGERNNQDVVSRKEKLKMCRLAQRQLRSAHRRSLDPRTQSLIGSSSDEERMQESTKG